MPWATPTLRSVRSMVRDSIRAFLPGSDANVPNSLLRVLSDCMGALCHLALQYIDWLAKQLLPDTAEHEWLDRHGQIWLVNADGSVGPKLATLSTGVLTVNSVTTRPLPNGSQLIYNNFGYETTQEVVLLANVDTQVTARSLDPGSQGNLDPGTSLSFSDPALRGQFATVVNMDGGTDDETDDQLRARVLKRIREPPQGGDKSDYEQWALAVPGVTRAWCAPLEMGPGTVTIRFMCDDLRASTGGFPTDYDIQQVYAYIDSVRPVAVKDFFVVAPIPQRCDVRIGALNPDTQANRNAIEESLQDMLFELQAPGQTIFAAWKSYAIMSTPGIISFDLRDNDDDVMQSPGHMGVLGDIFYDQ